MRKRSKSLSRNGPLSFGAGIFENKYLKGRERDGEEVSIVCIHHTSGRQAENDSRNYAAKLVFPTRLSCFMA